MIYVGIDNGISGALVALSDHPGPPVATLVMPTRGKSKGNEVDALKVAAWLERLDHRRRITILLETPGKFSPGVQAISSMWDSYGVLRAICEVGAYRHHRVTPQQWQKVMLPNCQKGDTKPAALARCRQLWPEESFLAPDSISKKPDTGLIDAALIAEFGRTKKL